MDKKIKSIQLKKRQAVELIKNIEQFISKYSDDQCGQIPVCLEQLEVYYEEFLSAVTKLLEIDEDAIEIHLKDRCEMDTMYRRVKGFLLQRQPSDANTVNDSVVMASTALSTSQRSGSVNVRLPKIELPTFDGDSTKWLTFRDRFVAMIDGSADIPAILKLQYLLSSLKGDAGMLFEHTSLRADNYEITWAALLKRYDNPRTLIREYYRKLHHLPAVASENVNDLANLVDECMRHVNGLKKLNEPVESWDTPLTSLVLMKLPQATIFSWEKHSATHKRDKYSELIEFLQDHIRILKSTQTFSQMLNEGNPRMVAGMRRGEAMKRIVGNMATAQKCSHHKPGASTYPQPSCPLGCAETHNIRMCPEFEKKEVQQRREFAAKERLCYNCLNRNHQLNSPEIV